MSVRSDSDAVFSTAPTRNPAGRLLTHARARWQAGETAQAQALSREILADTPGQPDALYLLALMAHAAGDFAAALEALQQACRHPDAPAQYFSDLAELCRLCGRLDEAETHARRAIALTPTLAAAWNNLGIAEQAQGCWAESLQSLQEASRLAPGDANVLNNLGNSHRALGGLAQARQCFAEAIAVAPQHAGAHCNLASLLRQTGHPAEGIACAHRAIALQPQFVEAYQVLIDLYLAGYAQAEAARALRGLQAFAAGQPACLLMQARVLQAGGHLPEARAVAQQLLAMQPQSQEAHLLLGSLLQQLDDAAGAAAAFERAAMLPGRHAQQAALNHAALELEAGNQEAACRRYEQIMQDYPASLEAPCLLIGARRVQAGDTLVARLESRAADPADLAGDTRIHLHFALGKACMDLGDLPQAFEHYDKGNAMKRSTFAYDAQQVSAGMARIAQAGDCAPAAAADASVQPVFIIGMPRSGTTLIEQILASHPMVTGAGELPTLRHVVDARGPFPEMLPLLGDAAVAAMGREYLQRTAGLARGSARLVDKMPSNFLYVGLILRMLPGARIIHIRRDALDTCLSCYTQLFAGEQKFAYDQRELGLFHCDYQQLMAHWRSVAPPARFLEIDYEAVVADLAGNTRRLLDFLGLPWDARCLRFHETQRLVRTASASQVRQPLYSRSIGRGHACADYLRPLCEALGLPAQGGL